MLEDTVARISKKYFYNHKYVCSMGLRTATEKEIAYLKTEFTKRSVPWVHRTKGLKFNGVMLMGNFKKKPIRKNL
jgi:hypothetical protein